MRILKVSQTYYPYLNEGGRPVKVKALAEHLARRGHEVVVVTTDLGNQEPGVRSQKPEVKSQKPRAMSHKICSGSPVEIHYLRTLARHRTLTLNPGIVPFCLRYLRQFDVVHIYGLYDLLGPTVAWFCRHWGIPYVVEPMGMYRPIVRSLRKKRLYHRLLGRAMIEGAARVIATSEQERHELVEEGLPPEKVVVRRNGLDLSEFVDLPPRGRFRRELGFSDGVPLVLFLGRLSRKKGLDLLLHAFAGLQTPAHLAIVGPDDHDGCVEEIRHLRRTLGLESRVTLLSPRFGRTKLEALVDADLFVLPSYNENFGNAAAEAIACGTPVIVSDQCGIAPWVRERVGMVVEFGERKFEIRNSKFEIQQRLREAIERVLGDEALRARFRANCLQVAQELSWDKAVREQERIYKDVVACAASPES